MLTLDISLLIKQFSPDLISEIIEYKLLLLKL